MSIEEINESNDNKFHDEIYILARTSKEKSSYKNLQSSLNQIKIIIRTIKDTNALYICSEEQWKQNIKKYMEQNKNFQWIGSMDFTISDVSVQETLITMSNLVVKTLHTLCLREAITTKSYEEMMFYNQTTIQNVNKLYFIPEIRRNEISIQPAMTQYKEEPMHSIVTFIESLLHPLIDRIVHSNFTFFDGHHVIKALENYTQQGLLRSTTLFVKIVIHDLSTTLSHHLLIEDLAKFLRLYIGNKHLGTTSITTIIQLVELILENQYCLYENYLYRQTTGGSIGSLLMNDLVDIYLYDLTHSLYSKLLDEKEVVGRCLNQLFFTWNESKDDLFILFNQLDLSLPEYTPTSSITIKIDTKIEYLGVEICQYEGKLYTKVNHDFNFEPYTLPYLMETKMLKEKKNDNNLLLYNALLRALYYCSNVDEFENEQLFIELSFIMNDVSINFIENAVDRFLLEFQLDMEDDTCIDQRTYRHCRQRSEHTNFFINKSTLARQEQAKPLKY